jgi:hypothetical protein
MSNIIGRDNLKRKSQIDLNFEIRNGILGVNRDIFLLLLGYTSTERGDNKTRNVLNFFLIVLAVFYFCLFAI